MLCVRGGAVFVLTSAGQLPWLSLRGAGLAVFRAVPCFAAPVVCASVYQGCCRRSDWFSFGGTRAFSVAWRFSGPCVVVAATSIL